MSSKARSRTFRALISAVAVVAALSSASATTTPDHGSEKVTICHVTNAENNPWVIIEVDIHAFDGEGSNDHSHHIAKDGRVDVEYDADTGCEGDTGGGSGISG